jgi:hypothetical protein
MFTVVRHMTHRRHTPAAYGCDLRGERQGIVSKSRWSSTYRAIFSVGVRQPDGRDSVCKRSRLCALPRKVRAPQGRLPGNAWACAA